MLTSSYWNLLNVTELKVHDFGSKNYLTFGTSGCKQGIPSFRT